MILIHCEFPIQFRAPTNPFWRIPSLSNPSATEVDRPRLIKKSPKHQWIGIADLLAGSPLIALAYVFLTFQFRNEVSDTPESRRPPRDMTAGMAIMVEEAPIQAIDMCMSAAHHSLDGQGIVPALVFCESASCCLSTL